MAEAQQQKSAAANVPMVTEGKTLAFKPRNFEELWAFVTQIGNTEMVPAADRGKTGQIIAKIQYGSEVGLPPMQSLRWIAVLPNGLPTIWGDGAKALVTSCPLVEGIKEIPAHETVEKGYGECTIKRKGWAEPVTRRFTIEMAKQSGLWRADTNDERQKASAWYKYPGRMLQWRAFHLCASDAVPEALGGLVPREIATDYDVEVTGTPIVETNPAPPQPLSEAQMTEETPEPVHVPPESQEEKAPAPKETKKTQFPSLEERRKWIETATLDEMMDPKCYALQNLSALKQNEQANVCRWHTERKNHLIIEEDKNRETS